MSTWFYVYKNEGDKASMTVALSDLDEKVLCAIGAENLSYTAIAERLHHPKLTEPSICAILLGLKRKGLVDISKKPDQNSIESNFLDVLYSRTFDHLEVYEDGPTPW